MILSNFKVIEKYGKEIVLECICYILLHNFDPPLNWSRNSIEYALEHKKENEFLFYLKEGKIIGFLVGSIVYEEAEIETLVIEKQEQKKGFAKCLVDEFIWMAIENDIQTVFLEVRKSNQKAYQFYLNNEFKNNFIRKNYYNNPTEDAMVMNRGLK